MSKEEWRDVKGYEGLYQVSNRGRVKSFYHDKVNGRLLRPGKHPNGYLTVGLYRDGRLKRKLVHRLVAEEFLPRSPGKNEANHKNGVKDDNRVENLEWATSSENHRHAFRVLGREAAQPNGEANGQSILTTRKVRQIRKLYKTGDHTQAELGKMFGVARSTISAIVRRETWKHVP